MSVPQVITVMAGSREDPIEILDDFKQIGEALEQVKDGNGKAKPLLESHENIALLNLSPLTFTRRPMQRMDMLPKQLEDVHWSHELYQSLKSCEPVTVTYCRTRQESEAAARRLWNNERLLGFDMEWKPRYTKGPAKTSLMPPNIREIKENASLIQLACESEVVIFHIAAHSGSTNKELVAPSLRKLLESPSVTKTGVAIMNADGVRLQKYLGIKPRGLFELSHLYKLVKYGATPETIPKVDKRLVALKTQVEEHLGLPLSKGKIRVSNWSKPVDLTPSQIRYAAADAYAGYMLFRAMDDKRKAMIPRPSIPAHVEQYLPIVLAVAPVDNAIRESRQTSHSKGQSSKTPIAEDKTDDGYFETADLSKSFKKPRIPNAKSRMVSSLGDNPGSTRALVQPSGKLPQHGTLPDRTITQRPSQPSEMVSSTSGSSRTKVNKSLGDSQVYDRRNRTMRQVFSALKGLTIQLAMKFDVAIDILGNADLLKYLAATQPESIKDMNESFVLQSEDLIRYCNLAGKDLFALIKRYTPSTVTVSTTAPASRDIILARQPIVDDALHRKSNTSQTGLVASPSTTTSMSREIKRKRSPLVSLLDHV